MNYKPDIQEKILGIFTPVRCLNEHQLRQYATGGLPAVEQHLIQQHLVDCELCNQAVETFRQKGRRQKFETIFPELHRQIRKEYFPTLSKLTPSVRKAHNLEKERKQEKLLISAWSVLLGAICFGGILFLAFHYKDSSPAGSAPIAGGPTPATVERTSISRAAEAPQQDSPDPRKGAARSGTRHTALLAENKATGLLGRPAVQKTSAIASKAKTQEPKEEKKMAGAVKAPDSSSPAIKPKARHDSSSNTVHHGLAGASLKNDTDLSGNPASLKGDHRDSTIHLRHIIPSDAGEAGPPQTDPDEVLYTSAKSYLAQGNVENAISRFKFLASDSENKYYQQARFQLALCYKAKGRNGKARKLLREIVANGGTMKTQAQVELESLQ